MSCRHLVVSAARCRCHTRHGDDANAGPPQVFAFRGVAFEADGTAACKPHDIEAALRRRCETLIDGLLTQSRAASALADKSPLGVAARAIKDFWSDELIVIDNVGILQRLQRPQRQKVGVTRPGADKEDCATTPGLIAKLAGARERRLGVAPT